MTDENDVLGNELAVEAQLTESGVNAKVKSRALSALDRLIGNLVDIPGAFAERMTRRIRAKTDTEITLARAETDEARKKLAASEWAGDRVLENFRKEQERKQDNRDAVAQEAINEIKSLPAPEDAKGEPEEVDPDWMNLFAAHAENASSDHLRKLWGRILAGEVRRPGSFSLSTLRAISELDKEIAQLFQSYAINRLEGGFLPKPKEMKNQRLLDLTFLEEVGLLQEVNGSLGRDLRVDEPSGFAHAINNSKLLRIKLKEGQQSIRMEVIRITRVGREIASILPQEDEAALLAYSDGILDQVDGLALATVVARLPNGAVNYQVYRTIK